MKITVTKEALMEKLIPAMGTVSNKNTITSIEGVLIETLSNGNIWIKVPSGWVCAKEGKEIYIK